jgi:signal transduction histidine kinase
MNDFFLQVFALLTSDTGSLAYHLVLVFSIAAALPAAMGYGQGPAAQTARRMVFGLGTLLLLRIILFASTGLIWQGLLSSASLLPSMERAITLLSLVVLIWMWSFPKPSKPADSGALLLGLLSLTAMILGLIWWLSQSTTSTYNGSFLDTVGEIYSLVLLSVGSLLLLIRRPHLWEIGLGMLAVMGIGHIFNLILPPGGENYSGVVRLTQMSAYPLLLALPQRLPQSLSRPLFTPSARSREFAESRSTASLDPSLLRALLTLSSEPDMQVAGPLVARIFAHISMADCCFIVYPPDSAGQMPIIAGYDLIREQLMQGFLLSGKEAPNLAAAMQNGEALRISAGEGAPDLRPIARGLGLERTGNLLFLPVALAEAEPLMGILFITPYTARAWSDQDQSLLAGLTHPLAQVLQRNQVLARMNAQLAELHYQSEDLKAEREKLLNQVKALRHSTTAERSQLESLAAMVATVESDQSTISSLMDENERLQGEIRKLQRVSPAEVERLEEELRLALQEVALLNAGLGETHSLRESLSPAHVPDTDIFEPQPINRDEAIPADASTKRQIKEIVSIAQELRQPMSSMIGYTDVLLAESQGILGSKQRKFVEKIRVAIQRMSRLVDELIHQAALESFNAQKQTVQEIDLSLAIDEAVAQTSLQLREKSIALRVEMPEALPHLYADPDTLRKIFVSLLQNAGNVTPDQGDIYLRARLESGDGRLDYVLVQVSDSGGGIPIDELPHLFSHVYQPPLPADPGSGQAAAYFGHNGTSLANVKKLVESVGGRILVDSQLGQGATFSVLLPVSSTAGASNT